MGVRSRDSNSGAERSRRRLLWIALVAVAGAGAIRAALALVDANESSRFGGWTVVDIVLLTLAAGVVLFGILFAIGTSRVFAGLAAVRAAHRGATVLPVAVREDQLDEFERLTGTKLDRPAILNAVLSPTSVSFWKGRRAVEIAVVHVLPMQYRVGSQTALYGTFASLQLSKSPNAPSWLTVFPMDERSVWFPRRIPENELHDLVERLEVER